MSLEVLSASCINWELIIWRNYHYVQNSLKILTFIYFMNELGY